MMRLASLVGQSILLLAASFGYARIVARQNRDHNRTKVSDSLGAVHSSKTGLHVGPKALTPELARSATRALGCGEVCSLPNYQESAMGKTQIKKRLSCNRVMMRLLAQHPATDWPPPELPPANLWPDFTANDSVVVQKWYFQQRYAGNDAEIPTWTREHIEFIMRTGPPAAGYGDVVGQYMLDIMSKYRHDIEGKIGMVIGTEKPWVEAFLLRTGAKHVITLEYGKIRSEHPRLSTALPQEIAALYLEQGGVQVDFIATYSSLEHSGLGRYGDSLNPFGDLEAMAQAWCMLKPGGLILLGVPTTHDNAYEVEYLAWNAHRMYGKRRMAQMAANFEFLEIFSKREVSFASEIVALRKPADAENRLYVE